MYTMLTAMCRQSLQLMDIDLVSVELLMQSCPAQLEFLRGLQDIPMGLFKRIFYQSDFQYLDLLFQRSSMNFTLNIWMTFMKPCRKDIQRYWGMVLG